MTYDTKTRRPSLMLVGGADVHTRVPLCRGLIERGFDVSLAGSSPVDVPHDIPIDLYDLHTGLSPLADLRCLASLRALLQRRKPALAHAFDTKPGYLLPMAGAGLHTTRYVRTVTGMGRLFADRGLAAQALRGAYETLYRSTGRQAFTVFQNTDDQEHFVSRGIARRQRSGLILGSGVEMARYANKPPLPPDLDPHVQTAEHLVVYAGRIMVEKGILDLFRAADMLRADFPTTRFVVAGTWDSRLKASVERAGGPPSNVDLLGQRADLPAILAHATLCILPTYYREGVPRVLLEAAASGIPIVATDVPGCREIMRHGVNGLTVKIKDPDSIAVALRTLLKDRELRQRMGQAGRDLVAREFSLPVVIDQLVGIYARVLGPQPAGGTPR